MTAPSCKRRGRQLLLALLCACSGAVFRGRAFAQEEALDAADEEAAKADEGQASSLEGLLKDPTLDGKLHLTYRVSYTAKVFDFKGYDFPFQPVSPEDKQHAEQLRRRHEDISDQDLDQYFSLRLEPLAVGEGGGLLNRAGGEASLRYFKDLDGSPSGEEARGGLDRFAGRQALQLYTLNARLETIDRHLELVLGRQQGRESEWIHFDGATATFRGLTLWDRQVELSGFAGSRATLYKRSASSLDGIHGGHIEAWLTDDLTLKFEDVYYVDNSLEARLEQRLGARGRAYLAYRQINLDPHSLTLDAYWDWLERQVTLSLLYIAKLSRNGDDFDFDYTQSRRRSRDGDNALYFNLGDIEPYDEWMLEVRKGLSDGVGIYLGGTLHRLRERDRKDNYNTDYQEAWIGLDLTNTPWEGFSGRCALRYVHTDLPRRVIRLDTEDVVGNLVPDFQPEDVEGDGEPNYLGLDLLLEQDFARVVVLGASALARSYEYRSHFARLEDLTAVSLGAHVRWRQTSRLQWAVRYAYDTDYRYYAPDLNALHTVQVSLQYGF